MAFGNMDDNSGTGVAFTRDPSTGEPVLAGEFLANAQGKDLVAGARAPQDLTEAVRIAAGADKPSLEAAQPKAFANLREACRALEHTYRDMQEVDFTIERGTVWLLRTRSGKRAARAAVTIAVDLADEGLLTRAEAILRVDPTGLDELVRPTGDPMATAPATSPGGPAEAAASPPKEAGARAGESKEAGAAAAMRLSQPSGDFAKLMEWADAVRRMRVRANAETLAEARIARACGAEGIGLWRTEQMFLGPDRLAATREMILAGSEAGRRAALQKLLPLQRADFAELFEITRGLPVTVRLLDAPLHEFLPTSDEDFAELATATGIEPALLRERTLALREVNPLLGRRGARLAIAYPEIAAMQARAIFEAAVDVGERARTAVEIEIMVPMVTVKAELDIVKALIDETANAIAHERGRRPLYKVGIMIEVPRAAIRAREMAATADFFSFGTDALTQTTFGMSREDAADFLDAYIAGGILASDPFATLDREGVGELVRRAVERGRAARTGLTIGICGKHGSDPASIAFCEKVGLDYVSCPPDRLLIARLAAAQAALQLSELSDDR
jgi:phosphoenolpyruvate synthase/pyruvate phosphate dikinase